VCMVFGNARIHKCADDPVGGASRKSSQSRGRKPARGNNWSQSGNC
jgi:hypothetical protein